MTTTVKIDACCSNNKKVIAMVTNMKGDVLEEVHMENGESKSFTIYDDRAVYVKEVEK